MSEPTTIHGVRVERMRWKPQRKDLVYHTHKHFLAREWWSEWGRAAPRQAKTPEDFVAKAAKMKVDLDAWDGAQLEECWWRGKNGSLARKAHDQGYAPRYLALIEQAGPFGGGGRWVRQHRHGRSRWAAETMGFRVAIDWRRREEKVEVVTAMRLRSVRDEVVVAPAPMNAFEKELRRVSVFGKLRRPGGDSHPSAKAKEGAS
jgi:hypothetical protein